LLPGARERPGDRRSLFTSELSGAAETLPLIAAGVVVTNADGRVLRFAKIGSDPLVIAARAEEAVEEGRVYASHWAVRRAVNSSDPLGDSIEFGIVCLNAAKQIVATRIIETFTLATADGRKSAQVTYSRDQEADITLSATTRYVRPFVRIYGGNGTTDVEVIGKWETNGLPGPKGDTGDITVAAQTARDESVLAEFGSVAANSAAQVAADRAEDARDSALANGDTYASTAAGVEAVAEGAYFVVPSAEADVAQILYRKVAGAAVETKRFLSASGQLAIAPRLLADPDYSFTVEDADGNVALRIRRDGVSDWAAGWDASNVYLYSKRFNRAFAAPRAGAGTPVGAAVHGAKVQYLLNNGGSLTPYEEWTEAENTAPRETNTLHIYVATGQSLGMADQAVPVLSVQSAAPRSRLLSFNDGVVVHRKYMTVAKVNDIVSETSIRQFVNSFERRHGIAGQTPFTSFGNRMVASLPSTTAVAIATVAVGAATYVLLKKGTVPYENLLRLIRRATFMARMQGWTPKVMAVPLKHGESNSTVSRSGYLGYLVEFQADLNADIKAITGQAEDVMLVMTQYTSWGRFGTIQGDVAKAIEDAARLYPNLFLNGGPDYSLPHAADDVHFSNLGSFRCGELMGRTLANKLGGGPGVSLYPISAVRVGTTITVTFNVPTGPIVLDTTTWANAGTMGVRFFDTGNTASVTGVTVASANSLSVELSSVPTGASPTLGFGDLTTLTTGSNIGVGPRTNIRDSSTDVSDHDTAPLYNWCVVTDIPVTV
jgi:hypothetical protein